MTETVVPSRCPNPKCARLLADTGNAHCDPRVRSKPCGWVTCSACMTIIDSRTGAHMPGSAGAAS